MKNLNKLFAIVLMAFAVSITAACTTIPSASDISTQNTTIDEKLLYTAEATYNVAARSYLSLVDSGVMTPETKAQAQGVLISMYDTLLALRTAYTIGDADTFNRKLTEFQTLKTQIEELI